MAVIGLLLPGLAAAHPPDPAPPGEDEEAPAVEVVVEGASTEGPSPSRTLDRAAVEALPARSVDDLLRAMPGLHQSAHGGHGKAYQYFLRGFDAVHGADLAVDLDGAPVNEPSNAHAHGYLDLHFVPPVLVEHVELWPGTWRADAGDFAVAGSASFHLGLEQPGALVWLGAGTDRSGQATLAYRPRGTAAGTFLVADASLGEGVGMARAWRQLRAGAGFEGELGAVHARAWVLAYEGAFESPGVLREDDLAAGDVSFYDAYPGSGGGLSRRVLANVQLAGGTDRRLAQLTLWGGGRQLSLEQNFTGLYADPVHGDGTRQDYAAASLGVRGLLAAFPSEAVGLRAGVDGRVDRLKQRERAIDRTGHAWAAPAELDATQADVAAWGDVRLEPTPWLRADLGLRGGVFLVNRAGQGLAWAPVLAPKVSVGLFGDAWLRGFASYGRGFRSPDARGAGNGGRAPVATADSVEAGIAAELGRSVSLRGAGFGTFVSDEIVFDHVAARYLATGSTRRWGVDGGVTVRPLEGVRLQTDVTWSDGRYARSGEPIPYAPRLLVSTGLYAERWALGPALLTAGVRAWVLGPRPLPGGFSGHAAAVVDVTSTVDLGRWRISVDVDNVVGTPFRYGDFVFPSRWDPTEPRAELPVRHFTAGAPRAARLSVGRRF